MYDILFVDDDLETAKEYAELTSAFTKLRSYVSSTKAEALSATRTHPIAIAVLDQRMPEISGTDLYKQLLTINPRLRAIMLSGEADPAEIGNAVNLRYAIYLHKSEFRQLPAVVLREFAKIQVEKVRDAKFERVFLFAVKHLFGIRGSTEFWLESFFVEEENFISDDSWRLADQINCGEKKQIKEKVELSSELKFERSLETEISANAEVAWKAMTQIQSKLSTALKEKVSFSHTLKENVSKENTRDIALPEEPKNPLELHVKSRAFYWAPVYRKIQCHVTKEMYPMKERNTLLVTTMQPTGKIATKQVDTFSDGTRKEVQTGTHLI
jgi:CheY-like chemotaxis protein